MKYCPPVTSADPVVVRLSGDRTALAAHAAGPADLERAVGALGVGGPRPAVAVVGGAGGLDETRMAELASLFTGTIAVVIRERGAVAVDGGTDSGVMRLLGRARAAGEPFPLVGVAAKATVSYSGHSGSHPHAVALEPNHTHFVLVPGDDWGAEAPYLTGVASALAGACPSVTVLVNGGEISLEDARLSLAARRPVLVLAGTGRAADKIAAAVSDPAGCGDSRVAALALSPLVRVIDVTDRTAAVARLRESLAP
jgi:hypothetical protein